MHRGQFYMGDITGMVVNIIAVAWLIFAIVFFSFPYYMPVTPQNMNYTCVCVGGFLVIAMIWWVIAGKRYTANMRRVREEEQNDAHVTVVEAGENKA